MFVLFMTRLEVKIGEENLPQHKLLSRRITLIDVIRYNESQLSNLSLFSI